MCYSVFDTVSCYGRMLTFRRTMLSPYSYVHNFYYSPNEIRATESRNMKWSGHASRMEDRRTAFSFFSREATGKGPLGKLRCEWMSKKQNMKLWTRFIWLWMGTSSRHLWTWKWTFWIHKIQVILDNQGKWYHGVRTFNNLTWT